eukprot:GHVR01035395.1.p1 GENE.GHVR01035395.1~~GHVR01035395.1.p1  ORF type:complete len:123 (+),score=12.81 GHVR01035395.1:3557-3925(+)
MVFLTFPHEILLLPFYLLSIYHLSSFVLSNKKIFERTTTYTICMGLSTYHVGLGRLALLTEILAVPLSFLMIFFRASSIVTFTTLAAIIFQQSCNAQCLWRDACVHGWVDSQLPKGCTGILP